jgi:hypothetical protein
MQKLGIEAFNDLLRKHGRAAVIENPYGQGRDRKHGVMS